MFLCYHGTDLERFAQRPEQGSAAASRSAFTTPSSSAISHLVEGDHQSSIINHQSSTAQPLQAVYLGSMGQGYDLMTILKVAARWKAEGQFPWQIHFAGTGDQMEQLKTYATQEGLLSEGRDQSIEDNHSPSIISHQSSVIDDSGRIVFHGFLQKNEINELLLSSDLALVANKPDSLVACPYKAGEYAAAGLPMLSCLRGELGQLLREWNAGSEYKEGDADSLSTAFEKYSTDLAQLEQQSRNARKMTEALFDRQTTYAELAAFITATR